MAPEPCFIDSNVPMYAVGADHPLKGPCVALLRAIGSGTLAAVTSVGVLQELLHRYTALGQREQAVRVVQSFMETVPDILPVTKEDVTAALTVRLSHPTLQTRDVMHVATMRQNGIRVIITADRHFDAVQGIRRVDPGDWSRDLVDDPASA